MLKTSVVLMLLGLGNYRKPTALGLIVAPVPSESKGATEEFEVFYRV